MPSPATFASPAAGTRIGQALIAVNTINTTRMMSTVTRVRGRMPLHRTVLAAMPRQRTFCTSHLLMRADGSQPPRNTDDTTAPSPSPSPSHAPSAAAVLAAKRKPRSAGAKNSLRRVAAIAQQPPPSTASPPAAHAEPQGQAEIASGISDSAPVPPPLKSSARAARLRREAGDLHDPVLEDMEDSEDGRNVISAVCLAESFDMERVMAILEAQGFTLDPDGSGFESHEVVHARKELYYEDHAATEQGDGGRLREVDLFVFESGTLVGWGLPADDVDELATSHLVAAAADPFVDLRETETLDFRRDPARDNSAMRGDVVVLGTRHEVAEGDRLATTRAQIAFSSGLARSTKLAVLERSFTDYFESTRRIPDLLAGRGDGSSRAGTTGQPGQPGQPGHPGQLGRPKVKGTKVLRHLSQKFVLQKTGELLSLRAQLNHYRELTDALPDIFWDARAELGLESYYEQVGRALDVGVRIKTLNQKMDYAQEIATVLREISSERHGTRLEWIIIVLITVEVVFELRRVYLDWHEDKVKE